MSFLIKLKSWKFLSYGAGEGVAVSVMHLRKNVEVYGVQYCAHTLAEREVFSESSEPPSRTGTWEFMTQLGSETGLLYRDVEE